MKNCLISFLLLCILGVNAQEVDSESMRNFNCENERVGFRFLQTSDSTKPMVFSPYALSQSIAQIYAAGNDTIRADIQRLYTFPPELHQLRYLNSILLTQEVEPYFTIDFVERLKTREDALRYYANDSNYLDFVLSFIVDPLSDDDPLPSPPPPPMTYSASHYCEKRSIQNIIAYDNIFLQIHDSFLTTLKKDETSYLLPLNLSNESSLHQLNLDVEFYSWGTFINPITPSMIEPEHSEDVTSMILLNLMSQNQPWPAGFRKNTNIFYLDSQRTKYIKVVEFPKRNYKYAQNSDYEYIALPFQNRKFQFEMFCPKQYTPISTLVQNLTLDSMNELRASTSLANLEGYFPLIDIKNNVDLSDFLKREGLERAFSRDSAKEDLFSRGFHQKIKGPIFIEKVLQQNDFKLDEYGLIAQTMTSLSSSSILGIDPIIPSHFYANKPFVFTISYLADGEPITLYLGFYTCQ